jgi:hypothetical protein
MISRRTALAIGQAYQQQFSRTRYTVGPGGSSSRTTVREDALYDFLFTLDYEPWFMNMVRRLHSTSRSIQEWVVRLHTGETQSAATQSWKPDARRRLGQRYLERLASDILPLLRDDPEEYRNLIASLELDGYRSDGDTLLHPEADVVSVEEEGGVLHKLYSDLGLQEGKTTFHHLQLAEEHFVAERWDDSISNSRKFLESVLENAAASHASNRNETLPDSRPTGVRAYLEKVAVITEKERKTIGEVYGLLSETGGHPYMARSDQARLMRQLSLTLSQFVLLRLRGSSRTG